LLAETDQIALFLSEQVVAETERALARKAPQALQNLRQAILASKAQIRRDPALDEVRANLDLIGHDADVPILVAAMRAQVDFVVTLTRNHFLDDPGVARRSGLQIGTPGDALTWLRQRLT
jgi:predicted nucleic acid-binding protein